VAKWKTTSKIAAPTMAVSQVRRLKNPVQGVDVEQFRSHPAAAQRPGYPDHAGEDKAL
jgi:hypothetical protein